jgi:hypothetical protein
MIALPQAEKIDAVMLDYAGLATRLGMTVDQVVWLRRKRKISFIRLAGNRQVRFWWPQVVEDLRRLEFKAVGRTD